ncbi:MAG: enoyl-CoA hydratase [Pseudomonadota bacterium]|nr:enoyl-CoA hydratase [Pseudomonadota bacterium]
MRAELKSDTNALVLRKNYRGVATLTLNRPNSRNALSRAMIATIQEELDNIADDQSVRAVVFAANGPSFCAGHDMRELVNSKSPEFYDELFHACGHMMTSIMRLPQPVIARVHGVATAAGCQLVATCDLAVATNTVYFATPGVHIGLFCSTPMVALSRNISRKQAMEMLILGEPLPAEQALEYGLINKVVPEAELDATISDIAAKILDKSGYTIKIGKEAFYRQLECGVEEAYAYTAKVMAENMMSHDAQEGVGAFVEKRKPVWRGE